MGLRRQKGTAFLYGLEKVRKKVVESSTKNARNLTARDLSR